MSKDRIQSVVVLILIGLFIIFGTMVGLAFHYRSQRDAANLQILNFKAQSNSCESNVHKQWDTLIDKEMGLDPSIAYQYKGQEQTALDQCQPTN